MKRRFLSRPVLVFAALALLGAGGLLYWQKPAAGAAGAEMRAIPVRLGDIEETVTAQGKLEPRDYVDVGVQVSGQLKKIHVEIGDPVKKGDLIAEIDPRVYESKVAADEAQLKSLQAQLAEQQAQEAFAQKTLDRNRSLIKNKAISQEALEDSQTALKVVEAKIDSLKAQMDQQRSSLDGDKTNLSYTKIYAPMNGTVVSQPVREGQTLNASQTAPVVVQVADLDIMTVRVQVAEADVMRLAAQMDVYFTTLGADDRKWHGKVRQILPTPETINDVVLYDALVDVENTNYLLMTGMSAQVFFIVGAAHNVPVIPVRALGKPADAQVAEGAGASYQVSVDNNGRREERTVTVGLMTRTLAEVKSGLSEGEKILVPEPAKKSSGGGARQGGMPGGPGRTPRL
ncbi:MAG: efflux RND transporter periplasmic adaptor subunit [Alphaproteobacteria bacterium]